MTRRLVGAPHSLGGPILPILIVAPKCSVVPPNNTACGPSIRRNASDAIMLILPTARPPALVASMSLLSFRGMTERC